jgi:hypothetical protein
MGDTKHNLVTKGAWVKLRAFEDLRAKHRKRALAGRLGAMQLDPNTGKPTSIEARVAILAGMNLAEDVAAMLITEWNIPYLPGAQLPNDNPELIGELTIEDNNRLLELTEEIRKKLIADRKTVDPSDYADPDSPSKPGSD